MDSAKNRKKAMIERKKRLAVFREQWKKPDDPHIKIYKETAYPHHKAYYLEVFIIV